MGSPDRPSLGPLSTAPLSKSGSTKIALRRLPVAKDMILERGLSSRGYEGNPLPEPTRYFVKTVEPGYLQAWTERAHAR